MAYANVRDQMRTKLDVKDVKYLFLGYCECMKAYRLIFLEMKKIIKRPDVVFSKDKTHLEDCPNGRTGKTPAVKVDISPKLDVEELEANDNDSKPDKEPNIENEVEADVPATKSTHNNKARKIDVIKKTATKPPSTAQCDNETMDNYRCTNRTRKPLGKWWKAHIPFPQDKENANMISVGKPRNLKKKQLNRVIQASGNWLCKRNTNFL